MRAVIDTNVLLSALLWGGTPRALLEHARNGTVTFISSPELAEVIDPPSLPRPVCRDPDDDAVLALALAAQADVVISGDDDLLSLDTFEGVAILTPAQALQRVLESL